MGYIDFDGVRYWDVREQVNYIQQGSDLNSKTTLQSDSRRRPDAINRYLGNMEVAQEAKHELEVAQRKDRKLRETAAKRRAEGGPKIDYSAYPNHPYYQQQ